MGRPTRTRIGEFGLSGRSICSLASDRQPVADDRLTATRLGGIVGDRRPLWRLSESEAEGLVPAQFEPSAATRPMTSLIIRRIASESGHCSNLFRVVLKLYRTELKRKAHSHLHAIENDGRAVGAHQSVVCEQARST